MAARLVRERITWALNGGTDIAQCNLHWLSPAGDAMADLAADTANATNAVWNAIRGYFYTGVIWTGHEYAEIDIDDGHVIATTSGHLPTSAAGSSGTNSLPPQIAEVITIRSAFAGASYRGRFYLPPMNTSVMTTSSQIGSTIVSTVVGAWTTYMRDAPGTTDYVPGVYSRTLHAFSGAVSLDMGNTFDTQRRRRSSFVESRTSGGSI